MSFVLTFHFIIFLAEDLGGVKILHGLDKVLEGGAVVLTLKDQNILADSDINQGEPLVPSSFFFSYPCALFFHFYNFGYFFGSDILR